MTRWIKISTTLLLAASAAHAQSFANLDASFDGRNGLKGFAPGSVIPVLREGRGPEAPVIGSLRPVMSEKSSVTSGVELVAVALEIVVPSGSHQPQAVADRLGRLSSGYRFAADPSFEPIRLIQFQILPFPPITPTQNAYLVRGVLPLPKLLDLKQDGAVRQIYQERSVDTKGLEEVVLRNGKVIRRMGGVLEIYVGFDCGVKEKHFHIQAHRPAIVVVTDGSVALNNLRSEIFQAEPSLALEPIVFVQR